MSFDPKGTAPGLIPATEKPVKILHMKCRKEDCRSMQATEVSSSSPVESAGAPHFRIYRCAECGSTWNAAVGGFVNL